MNKPKKELRIIEHLTMNVCGMPVCYPIFEGISYEKQIKEINHLVRSIELRNLFNLKDIDEGEKMRKIEDKACPKCHKREMKITYNFENRKFLPTLVCRCGYYKEINLNKYKRG